MPKDSFDLCGSPDHFLNLNDMTSSRY